MVYGHGGIADEKGKKMEFSINVAETISYPFRNKNEKNIKKEERKKENRRKEIEKETNKQTKPNIIGSK